METYSLTFGEPLWFWALAIIPILAVLYYWVQRRSNALIAKIVAPRLRSQLASAVSIKRRTLKAALILTSLALLIVALAQPRLGYVQNEIKQKGRDVIFVIDTSRSMLSTDIAPTRLVRAKLLAQDLIGMIHGDRVGVVAFAGNAFLQAPLTLDYGAVLSTIDDLDTNVIPLGGTNIAAGIDTAVEAFGSASDTKTQAIILMTDGEELEADGVAAAKRAAQKGIRIFTVGIGSPEGSLIPIRTDDGRQDFVRDENDKPVLSRLDERRLKEIAEASGGFYTHLEANTAQMIYDKGIKPMSSGEKGTLATNLPIERYQWPLSFALILLTIWTLLSDRKRQPTTLRKRVRKAVPTALLLIAFSSAAKAVETGYEDYQAGQYTKAMQDFQYRLKTAPNSDKLQFDAGATAYKLSDYNKAADYFTKALLSDDTKLREEAAYNLANSLVRRGEAAQSKDDKKADWKNAVEHYTEALKIDPKDKQAQENREIVKKLLEDLDKQQKQQQQQNQPQQNQNQNNQQQNNQQNQKPQNQNNQDKQKNDQQKQNQSPQQQNQQNSQANQNPQNQQNQQQSQNQQSKEQKSDQQNQPQQNQNPSQPSQEQQNQEKRQPEMAKNNAMPTPSPSSSEKKEGQIRAQSENQKNPSQEATEMAKAEKNNDNQMTPAQARALLNSLKSEDAKVNFTPRDSSQEQPVKDW